MQNIVRVVSNENVVRDARIYLRAPAEGQSEFGKNQGEWVDVSTAVQSVTVDLTVGKPSRASLDVVLVDANVEAVQLDIGTLRAFASVLRLYGWAVMEPC